MSEMIFLPTKKRSNVTFFLSKGQIFGHWYSNNAQNGNPFSFGFFYSMKKYKLCKLFLYNNIMILTLFLLVIFALKFDKTLTFVTLTDTGHILDIIWISFCPTPLDFQGKTDPTSYGIDDVLDREKIIGRIRGK